MYKLNYLTLYRDMLKKQEIERCETIDPVRQANQWIIKLQKITYLIGHLTSSVKL